MDTFIKLKGDVKGPWGTNNIKTLTPNQTDLIQILTQLWNNQDRLTKEDIDHLEFYSKK